MTIRWRAALAVGHPEIDRQHQELFARAQLLVDALARRDRAEVGRQLDFLDGYAVDHFTAEEQLMIASSYPGRGVHKAEHDRFVRDYRALRSLVARHGPVPALAVKARTWLGDWLERHVSGSDQRLGAHLSGVRARRSA
jgi:hemerythrin